MDSKTLAEDEVFRGDWYHSIELAPGLYTEGLDFRNIELTRTLLRRFDVQGLRCLDIGVEDGMFSVLFKRRGANEVVGYDRLSLTHRIDLVRNALEVDFEYLHGFSLAELPARLEEAGHEPFDIVLFSGVLYHMIDPLAGVLLARGLVRNGGLMVLETAGIVDDQMAMHFNHCGRFNPGTCYWLASVGCLDYMARFSRLQPIDCTYFLTPKKHRRELGLDQGRVAIVCRAVDRHLPDEEDTWMTHDTNQHVQIDFDEFLDWNRLESSRPPVPYAAPDGLVDRMSTGGIDVYESMKATPAHELGTVDRKLSLNASS